MSAQWPTNQHIRNAWIAEGFHRIDSLGKTRNQVARDTAAEFDAWFSEVRAEAWDAGHRAGAIDERQNQKTPNPYQQEDAA